MDFSHYGDDPVEIAADLVNSDQRYFDGTDRIADLGALEGFLARWAHLWEGETLAIDPDDLGRVQQLRPRLRAIFEAPDAETAVERINRLLIDNAAVPRLSTHGGHPHLHFEPLEPTVSQWLAVVTAMGLATVVAEHGIDRFGTCAAGTCEDVFVDTSRNRSRRHCSTTCSTRENVAAYRRRRRSKA